MQKNPASHIIYPGCTHFPVSSVSPYPLPAPFTHFSMPRMSPHFLSVSPPPSLTSRCLACPCEGGPGAVP